MPPKAASPGADTGTGQRTTLSAPIQTLDHIDKELTYRQRLNRPFKVIQHLPLSTEVPDYTKLAHPLSIKDSAVIHNALNVSRFNWCHYMFRAFWTRKEQYVPVSDSKKRDRTAKLCTCEMKCGPHTFDVKFFILKDEERERRFVEEQDRRRAERQKRKQEREEAQSKRQDEIKVKLAKGVVPTVAQPTKGAKGVKKEPKGQDPLAQITPAIEIEIPAEGSKVRAVAKKTEDMKRPAGTKDIMANPEQAQMITNLNTMAKSDSHLNTLMKKVASGGATPDQIAEFQQYIQKAKDMSKRPEGKALTRNAAKTLIKPASAMTKKEVAEENRRKGQEMLKRAEELRKQQEEARMEKARMREEREREKLRIKQLKAEKRERVRLEKERMKQQAREERERYRTLKKDQRDAEKERDQIEKMERKMAKLKEEAEQDEDVWNDKLTIFQERYASNASLIFEFNESTTSRFFFPNDAIFELVENAETESSVKEEFPPPPVFLKGVTTPYVTILASFLLVHNQAEIDGWERRLAEKKRASEMTEEEKKKKRKKTASWTVTKRITRHSRQVKAIEAERDEEENYHVEDEMFEENKTRPLEVYSCVTVTLSRVPFRYANLILASGNDPATSRANMAAVMRRGRKLPQSWVWNQLDGVKDEILGETLRYNLQRLDYVNGGGKLKGKLMHKKLMELGDTKKQQS